MQFPESWLREFCDPPLTTQQLADTLTMGGLEVDEMRPVAPPFTGVVVGEIKETALHLSADRLRVCQVDVGHGQLLNIVCGAPNARNGIKVPCALIGAELPPGNDGMSFLIKLSKLRGVESAGMLCSARELKLSEDHGGLLELAADAPVGIDIRQLLRLDDTIFTLKLTPNLAHALSIFGVARELSALTRSPLKQPRFLRVQAMHSDTLEVNVKAPDLCGRFSGRIVRNVDTRAKTPAWMVERLARCGQRSVTALVDISNYVMFEHGQPSHIFDFDQISGALDVRWGLPGEQLRLLSGATVTVDGKVGVIADAIGIKSLAGIMGGHSTAISDITRNVYVEGAFWWPQAIQGRSRRFNFATDAGHRFERGVDPSRTVEQVEHITRLIIEICGGEPGPMGDEIARLPEHKPVALRTARAVRVIGMPLTAEQCLDALSRLGLPVSVSNDVLTVVPPAYRFDLSNEEDLIEEVVRILGFHNLPKTPPLGVVCARLPPEASRNRFAISRQLAALGYQETINFSFVEERWERDLAGNTEPVRLLNPIASQMNVMRSSLIASLLQVLKFNLDRKATRVRVFETGRVFLRNNATVAGVASVSGLEQPIRIAGLVYGDVDGTQWGRKSAAVDFFDAKGDVQALLSPWVPEFKPAEHPAMHPGRCARVLINGLDAGVVGELHPRWCQAWELPYAAVVFELDFAKVAQRRIPMAIPIPRFQPVERDIAVVVDDVVSHAALMTAIHAADTKGLLHDALLFDVYKPQSTTAEDAPRGKSLAVRLMLGSTKSTLTDGEIDMAVKAVVKQIADDLGGRLRSQ